MASPAASGAARGATPATGTVALVATTASAPASGAASATAAPACPSGVARLRNAGAQAIGSPDGSHWDNLPRRPSASCRDIGAGPKRGQPPRWSGFRVTRCPRRYASWYGPARLTPASRRVGAPTGPEPACMDGVEVAGCSAVGPVACGGFEREPTKCRNAERTAAGLRPSRLARAQTVVGCAPYGLHGFRPPGCVSTGCRDASGAAARHHGTKLARVDVATERAPCGLCRSGHPGCMSGSRGSGGVAATGLQPAWLVRAASAG